MRNYQLEARKIMLAYLASLDRQEKRSFILLAKQWSVISKELESMILRIAEKQFKTENQLYQYALYQKFLDQSNSQIHLYSKYVANVISDNQQIFGKAGIDAVQDIIRLKYDFFQKLPVDVINNFIGRSFYDGSKLDETLFAKTYTETMERVKNRLLEGVALGRNPRVTANLIVSDDMNVPLWKALRLSRTEQISIFRDTSLMQMEKSGVVKEWEWLTAKDEKVCGNCGANDGKRFPLHIPMDTHPNCRCCELPIL